MRFLGRGGVYACPGIATDVGQTPVNFFSDLAVKNTRLQGVWVSDTNHLKQAVDLVASRQFPFEELITHRFLLKDVNKALQVTADEVAIKSILLPQETSL
jgi:threonine dehydrogenase-like Zn-dependent dehydrogenase